MVKSKDTLDKSPYFVKPLQKFLRNVDKNLCRAAKGYLDNIEFVHQLRVNSRRAIAAISFFKQFLNKNQARWLLARLDKIRKAAGRARDLDVLIERISSESGGAKKKIVKRLVRLRQKAQKPIHEIYDDSLTQDSLVKSLKRLIRTGHRGSRSTGEIQFFTCRRFIAMVQALLESKPKNKRSLERLHQFRIRCKKLRYVVELTQTIIGHKASKKISSILESLQEELGSINDSAVAYRKLKKLVRYTREMKSSHSLCQQTVARCHQEKKRLRIKLNSLCLNKIDKKVGKIVQSANTLISPN